MRISIKSVLSDLEISSISFGEVDLMAHSLDAMFESLRAYEKENKVKITDISIRTEDVEWGREITIKGSAGDDK